jgi:hypothetical protein
MDFKQFENKRVYCRTNSDRVYIGEVKEVEFIGFNKDNVAIYFISLIDKYGSLVGFNSNDLKFIEEER